MCLESNLEAHAVGGVLLGRRGKANVPKDSIGAYAVQCGKCYKWRLIPSKEEYETIRETFIEDPWVCEKRLYTSCDDLADIEYNTSNLWVFDKPNIPKAPPGTQRMLIMRKDLSKMDTHYIMPNGKKLRSTVEVEKFLAAHPEYKESLPLSRFCFTVPKISEDMVPKNLEKRASSLRRKKRKADVEEDN
ncbi:Methyl-CpG-binding domain-containing protein 4 [Apostasia shenzhenica]|uniref:Methyl-CpG-binding domain-containing protein 4 n=1 Tax=Apostasia shenzhenica TaxID=1088818 RepID=A0A2I0AZC4_9ASPA|nr:Methyl-CpG-binding domain-containing protein 4 [Apostasia shenzhenica]